MPNDINQIVCTGRLTKENELKTIGSGKTVLNNSIAINKGFWSKARNEFVKSATFLNFTIWAKAAERFAEATSKGDWVMLSGEMEIQSWVKTDGTKVNSPNINVREWNAGPKKKQETDTSFDVSSFDTPSESEFDTAGAEF